MEHARELHVQVHAEDGSLWATIDEYPGVFATGDDIQELHDCLAEGLALVFALPGEEPPEVQLGPLATTARLAAYA